MVIVAGLTFSQPLVDMARDEAARRQCNLTHVLIDVAKNAMRLAAIRAVPHRTTWPMSVPAMPDHNVVITPLDSSYALSLENE